MLHRQQSQQKEHSTVVRNTLSCLFLISVVIILPDFIKQNILLLGVLMSVMYLRVNQFSVGFTPSCPLVIIYPLSQDHELSPKRYLCLPVSARVGFVLHSVFLLMIWGTLNTPAGAYSLFTWVFFFRNSGRTPDAGSCRWQRNCLSWKSHPKRPDEDSPGLEMGGKVTAASRGTTGLRTETGDAILTSHLINLW